MSQTAEVPTTAEQIALWADRLRDLSAAGLHYAVNDYDRKRYAAIQDLALEMLSQASGKPPEALEHLKASILARMSPLVAGAAAVIDDQGKILLMRRTDNSLWAMPAGQLEVGETPAEGVVRCVPKALVGVYDSRRWDRGLLQHVYKFTFLCEPRDGQEPGAIDPHETMEIGWFDEDNLPADLYPGHRQRIADSYRVMRGDFTAHFD